MLWSVCIDMTSVKCLQIKGEYPIAALRYICADSFVSSILCFGCMSSRYSCKNMYQKENKYSGFKLQWNLINWVLVSKFLCVRTMLN